MALVVLTLQDDDGDEGRVDVTVAFEPCLPMDGTAFRAGDATPAQRMAAAVLNTINDWGDPGDLHRLRGAAKDGSPVDVKGSGDA